MGLGLARFAAQTPTAPRLRVTYDAPAEQGTAAAVRDPWNFWVFEVAGGGNFSAEEHVRDVSFSGSLDANRVTEAWKVQLEANSQYNESNFDIPVTDSAGNEIGMRTLTSISRRHEVEALVVRSLGRRWSAGAQATGTSATFENLRWSARLAPAVEFNVFPYAEATRRALVLRYSIGVRAVAYQDTTIFDKLAERLVDERLEASLQITQLWGTASVELEASHYFHDAAKYRIELSGSGEFRLYKGLSLNVYGGASRVRDQITLPKAGATPDEVLLRRRELATGYQVYGGMSLSFTFGSIFSTIVNPRFDI